MTRMRGTIRVTTTVSKPSNQPSINIYSPKVTHIDKVEVNAPKEKSTLRKIGEGATAVTGVLGLVAALL